MWPERVLYTIPGNMDFIPQQWWINRGLIKSGRWGKSSIPVFNLSTRYSMTLLSQIPMVCNKHMSLSDHISILLGQKKGSGNSGYARTRPSHWVNVHFGESSCGYHGRGMAEYKWCTVSSCFHPTVIYHISSHLPKPVVNPHLTSKGAGIYLLTLCPERGDLWTCLMTYESDFSALSPQWIEESMNPFIKQSFAYADLAN